MGFIIIYVTHKSIEEAKRITSHLLNKKLIACGNFFPIEACYWWKNNIETANEFVSILKTRIENWSSVKSEIEKIHTYEVPCIMKFNVEANESYEKWIYDETIDAEKKCQYSQRKN